MTCPSCGKKTTGDMCRSCLMKQKVKDLQACPQWVALISNKTLPPMVFFAISLFALTVAASFDSTAVRINLALASAFSSAVGLYIMSS